MAQDCMTSIGISQTTADVSNIAAAIATSAQRQMTASVAVGDGTIRTDTLAERKDDKRQSRTDCPATQWPPTSSGPADSRRIHVDTSTLDTQLGASFALSGGG